MTENNERKKSPLDDRLGVKPGFGTKINFKILQWIYYFWKFTIYCRNTSPLVEIFRIGGVVVIS